MRLRHFVPLIFCISTLAGISMLKGQEAGKATPGTLTIEDIVRMAKANVSEDIIIARVKTNARPFDLNADEIVELKNDGVSDTVVKYMIDPSQPYSPPAPPAAAAAAAPPAAGGAPAAAAPAPPPPPPPKPRPTTDPLALKLPPDPGIYYLMGQDQFTPLAQKTVVPRKQPGKASKLSAGLIDSHIIGSVVGPTAGTRVAASGSVFYLRLPEKAMIEDFTLVMLDKAGNRRDIDCGTKQGKTVFPVNSVKQFDSKEVATGIYRLNVPMLKKGEYFFFVLGSGDDKKGLLGKGYELGVN